jgi:class 3 adenylate cyclase
VPFAAALLARVPTALLGSNPQRVNSGRLLIPERIDAVVWFSDLRGFTRITKSGSPRTLPSKDALSKHSAEMVLEIQSTACRD